MMMAMLVAVIVVVVVGIVAAVNDSKKREEMRQALLANSATQQYVTSNMGVGVNDAAKLVIFTLPGQNARQVPFRDLLQSEVIEDGVTLTKTQRNGVIGRGILGTVIAGPFGMLAGALTASQTSTSREKVRKVDLRILLAATSNPVYTVNFLNSNDGVLKSSQQYRSAREQADRWHATVQACIRRADADEATDAQTAAMSPEPSTPSVADELNELADLRSRGILDDTEFAEQKAVVLARTLHAAPVAKADPPVAPVAPPATESKGWPFS